MWIGRFDVKPLAGNNDLGSAKGAIVNVVALAADEDDYVRLVAATMTEYEFEIVGYEDVAPLNEWLKENRVHPDLQQLARGLTAEHPIQFDEFQSYVSDDA